MVAASMPTRPDWGTVCGRLRDVRRGVTGAREMDRKPAGDNSPGFVLGAHFKDVWLLCITRKVAYKE